MREANRQSEQERLELVRKAEEQGMVKWAKSARTGETVPVGSCNMGKNITPHTYVAYSERVSPTDMFLELRNRRK